MRGKRILVTGGAGFIGSHVAAHLARENEVVILDNFATGHRHNVPAGVTLLQGDLRDATARETAVKGADVVIHEAALPSVARSIENPVEGHDVNATGTLLLLRSAHQAGVGRFVYAASSSAYGDTPTLPKVETMPPAPRSPYAVAKLAGEQYCKAFATSFGLSTVALRYFNVFGPRQDPDNPYAAVIPRFATAAATGRPLLINGDGSQTRDFTFVEDAVQATVKAAHAKLDGGEVMNVAGGRQVSVLELARKILAITGSASPIEHGPPRAGDIKDSLADISKARRLVGYEPRYAFDEALRATVQWFAQAPAARARAT